MPCCAPASGDAVVENNKNTMQLKLNYNHGGDLRKLFNISQQRETQLVDLLSEIYDAKDHAFDVLERLPRLAANMEELMFLAYVAGGSQGAEFAEPAAYEMFNQVFAVVQSLSEYLDSGKNQGANMRAFCGDIRKASTMQLQAQLQIHLVVQEHLFVQPGMTHLYNNRKPEQKPKPELNIRLTPPEAEPVTENIVGPTFEEALATAFTERLRAALSSEQLAEIDERNEALPVAGVCASLEYCDSAHLMLLAYEQVTGKGVEVPVPDFASAAMNRAWALAKERGYSNGN